MSFHLVLLVYCVLSIYVYILLRLTRIESPITQKTHFKVTM